jgi:hypothetical protein
LDGDYAQRTTNQDDVLARTEGLVESWCDRRCLRALREILGGYPLASPLTDGWGQLGDALRGVRAFAREELTTDEAQEVERLIAEIDRATSARLG